MQYGNPGWYRAVVPKRADPAAGTIEGDGLALVENEGDEALATDGAEPPTRAEHDGPT